MRGALAGLEEKNRQLAMEHALLNIKHDTQNREWQRLLTDALQSSVDHRTPAVQKGISDSVGMLHFDDDGLNGRCISTIFVTPKC